MKVIYTLPFFLLLAVIQLFIPIRMVVLQERTLQKGVPYKFRTAPVDPNDPFRGKYITLRFEAEQYETQDTTPWQKHEKVFVFLSKDRQGFASIEQISRKPPLDETDYFQATVSYISLYGSRAQIDLRFPFDRYYMEETKAPEAEEAYRSALQNRQDDIYALVYVKNGKTVLDDVRIGDRSIRAVVSETK